MGVPNTHPAVMGGYISCQGGSSGRRTFPPQPPACVTVTRTQQPHHAHPHTTPMPSFPPRPPRPYPDPRRRVNCITLYISPTRREEGGKIRGGLGEGRGGAGEGQQQQQRPHSRPSLPTHTPPRLTLPH
ncbi:hypothetical protein E2C01_097465 [Portunus trituberculatus]|uniref:Uncharacterized protein n=1 Tax=Portunus trituberculatus TaxID=210409 RepID=A0A5B7K4W8_PORTR|nr:hypothetical protein [Portunus trituberculatus]